MKHSPLPPTQFELVIPTTDGEFVARYSAAGLCGLSFPAATAKAAESESVGEIPARVKQWHSLTTQALKAVLAGRPASKLPPLDLSAGTVFQQRVWNALLKIGSGRTKSYGEVAAAIGQSNAMRAVGGACGANPIPVLVPCHRVLAAGGRIGGFSSDISWKRKLLAREAAEQPVADQILL